MQSFEQVVHGVQRDGVQGERIPKLKCFIAGLRQTRQTDEYGTLTFAGLCVFAFFVANFLELRTRALGSQECFTASARTKSIRRSFGQSSKRAFYLLICQTEVVFVQIWVYVDIWANLSRYHTTWLRWVSRCFHRVRCRCLLQPRGRTWRGLFLSELRLCKRFRNILRCWLVAIKVWGQVLHINGTRNYSTTLKS